MSSDIFDYSPHLLKMQTLVKRLTESTLHKDWELSKSLAMQVSVEAKLLLNWLNKQEQE